MTPIRRITPLLMTAALAVTCGLALVSGCEKSPSEPVFDNVFDPQVPGGGNPLQLTATLGDTAITLSWSQPQGFGISYYELSHSLNRFSDYLVFGSVEHTDQAFATLRYPHPSPTAVHYFKVQAFDEAGNFTRLADQAPAVRSTPPAVVAGDGSGSSPSRNITLAVTVSAGDSLRISNHRDFTDELRTAAGATGEAVQVPWILPVVTGNDTTITVRVLAFPLTGVADTAEVDIDVDFAPAFTVQGDPATVPSRALTLDIPDQGVVWMRFAASEEGLDSQFWQSGNDTAPFVLADNANPQTVWGQFLGDFGFAATASLTVTPDLLEDAAFALDLPEDHLTDQPTVTVVADAVATQMRFSESLDFTAVPWIPYAETGEITLSGEPGRKTIYGQFRNDWAESAILTDYVIYLSQPLAVAITAPDQDDEILSGSSLQVQGTATAPGGAAAVDSVKFDAGDGQGFVSVTGLENWSYLWEVPVVTESTPHLLRARAWAAGDSVTTTRSVTLAPEP